MTDSTSPETPTTETPIKQKRVTRKTKAPAGATLSEVAEAIVKPVKKKKYLNNADLMTQIRLSREAGSMNDELAKMLTLLCEKYSKHPDYANIYSYVDDMKAFAMLTVVKVWRAFDPNKGSNPFAYFTQIIRHAFYQYLNHETKQRHTKDVLMVDIGELPSYTFMENYADERDYFDGEDDEPRQRRDGREDHTAPGLVTEIHYALGGAPEEESTGDGEASEL